MKKFLPIVAFLCIGILHFSFDDDCYRSFHSGHYTLIGQEDKYKLIRTEQSQVEVFNNGKSKIFSDIEWISKTEYKLTLTKLIHVEGCLKKGNTVRVKIEECTPEKIVCTYETSDCGAGVQTFVPLK